MNKEIIIRRSIMVALVIFYLLFTTKYARVLNKSVLFDRKIKAFHSFMIWFVPFVWILILMTLTKSTPGSHEVENKSDPKPYSDAYENAGDGINLH